MLNRIIEVLNKVQFAEAQELVRELTIVSRLNPTIEPSLQLRMAILQSAQKNAAKAVEALEHLDLVDEAMEFHSVIHRQMVETRAEADES